MNTLTTLFQTILNMSLAASIVAAAVMVVRLPLKKAPKIFSYALWAFVFIRLVLPFSFTSQLSVLSVANPAVSERGGVLFVVPSASQPGIGRAAAGDQNRRSGGQSASNRA